MKLEVVQQLPAIQLDLPPLLFVHGGSHGAWCWEEHFLPYFSSAGYPVYALSLRGHGNSGGLEQLHRYTLGDYADDVRQVMAQIPDKPVLIGHSLGGAVVQQIASAAPERLRAAVLLASVPPEGMLRDGLRSLLRNFRLVRRIGLYNRGKIAGPPVELFFSERLSAAQAGVYARQMLPESLKVSGELRRRIVPVPAPGTPPVPIWIAGSRQDRIFSVQTTLRMGRTYGVEPVIFEDICHDMMLDPNWKQVADHIRMFLKSIQT